MTGRGFLGTQASWAADLNLIAQIVLLVLLTLSVLRAKKGDLATHHTWMTVVVIVNAVLIVAVMNPTFFRVLPAVIRDPSLKPKMMFPHFLVGGLAELLGLYAVVAVRLDLPIGLRAHRQRSFMRALAILWTLALVGGIALYALWYL
jgi:F0F1-type ATP synthase membrane subunit c/vacuolar-type H+-ATPase subunit K